MFKKSWRKERRSNPRLGRYAAMGLAVFGLFCFMRVWQNVTVDDLNRQTGELRQQLKASRAESARLTARVEDLKHPDRIQRIAQDQLDFKQASKFNLFSDDEF